MYGQTPSIAAGPPSRSAQGDIAPELGELALLAVAVLIDLSLYAFGAYGAANLIAPLLLGAILSWGMWRLVRRSGAAVWTPLFSLRAGIIVWLAIGSLVPFIPFLGGEASLDWIDSYYSYTPKEAAKVNLLFAVGTLTLLTSILASSLLFPAFRRQRRARVLSESNSLVLGLAFVAIGHFYGFFIALPVVLGWVPAIIPGSAAVMFTVLGAVGSFLIALWVSVRGGFSYVILILLILISLFHSLLMLEKSGFILTVLLIGLAFLLRKTTLLRLIALALSLGLSLAFITPPVTQARVLQSRAYGDLNGGTIEERAQYHIDYLYGHRVTIAASQDVSSFVRLHYLPYATFVVSQYDAGLPSDRIENGLYALVPRVIWPDKPLVSDIGTELNYLVTGYDTSSLGATLFGDLYWNFGWAGLLLLIPTGLFLWWASLTARDIVEERDWMMMPFVLLVFLIGMSVDNHFILRWVAPAVISIVLLGLLRIASHLVSARGRGVAVARPVQVP